MRSRSALALVVCVLLSCPAAAWAQTDADVKELVTDRPDFTESSDVVGHLVVQLEMGANVAWTGEAGFRDRTVTLPLALLRLGISRRFELRLSTDGYVVNSFGRSIGAYTSKGRADMEVGAKYVLRDADQGGFAFAVIPILSLPTGADGFSSGTVDPTFKFTWATNLPKAFDISGNVNVSRLGDSLGRYTEHVLSVSLAHALVGGWGGYAEVFGFTPHGRPDSSAWTVDAGVTHLLGENAQIDFEFGRGLTAAAPSWFVGTGVAFRTAALRRHR